MECLISLLLIVIFVSGSWALFPGIYCGEKSCYEVLDVDRDFKKSDLKRNYRKLAAKWHPDKHRSEEAKAAAEIQFRLIATAYETLKDDDTREEYDDMLDNPEQYYYHYYTYYRRRVAPKVDVRIVIAGTLIVISIIQYVSAYHKYNEAIAYMMSQHKFRAQAQQIAKERGDFEFESKKAKRKQTKAEIKERDEQIIKSIIEENADIKGGYQKPSLWNVLCIQMFLWPWYILCYIHWYLHWTWTFTINKQQLGDEQKLYLIRSNMKLSQGQFDSLDDKQHQEFWRESLWLSDKFAVWKAAKDEEMKVKQAESGQYKRYRRYMRNNGPGQITFGPED